MFGFGRVNHRTGSPILKNGGWVTGRVTAWRFKTVPALIREKQPSQLAVNYGFPHSDQFISIKGEIFRILIRAAIYGLLGGKVMPLFTGDLAASAGHAKRRIDKKCVIHM
jgi:hypothetical protein